MLGAFDNYTPRTKQVPLFQSLEPEIIKHEITVIRNHSLVNFCILTYHIMMSICKNLNRTMIQRFSTFKKSGGGSLLVIRDDDSRRELSVIRMVPSLHHRTRFGRQFIKLGRRHSIGKLVTYFLSHKVWIHMVKSIRKTTNSLKNLVKAYWFSVTIPLNNV
uniref:Uncharacterized protein n=1 Tax=viral metagenome TaxID=1070528 RepID=A0A6C0AIF9_9ZZZZ